MYEGDKVTWDYEELIRKTGSSQLGDMFCGSRFIFLPVCFVFYGYFMDIRPLHFMARSFSASAISSQLRLK